MQFQSQRKKRCLWRRKDASGGRKDAKSGLFNIIMGYCKETREEKATKEEAQTAKTSKVLRDREPEDKNHS